MNTLYITYLLDDTDVDYSKISARIKKYPDWAKIMSRSWIIRTSKSSKTVRSELSNSIDGKGKILVINISDSAWASYRLGDEINEWLKEKV